MKFKKTKFQAAFSDGVLEMDGYAFDIGSRQLVAHKSRPTLRPVFPYWLVSERTSGFAYVHEESRTRSEAVSCAVRDMPNYTDLQWKRAIARSLEKRAQLPRISLSTRIEEKA